MAKKIVYLDSASTTQTYKRVAEAVKKASVEVYGNPSSSHLMGEKAASEMNSAREVLAKEINAKSHEIIFTSGATEADNLAIMGIAKAYPNKKRIIISSIEHPAVYEPCMFLKSQGYDIVEVPVDKEGLVNLIELESKIDQNTLLVSIIHAHNEIGVLQDLNKIGEICKRKNVLLHTDAVQSYGKEIIDVKKMNISLLSASAHKIGGPKGVGFLYVKDGVRIEPIIYGGGQEKGIRGGTENVPAIVGFAEALKISKKINLKRVKVLRDYLIDQIENIGGHINGSKERRLANNVNARFNGVVSEGLIAYLSSKGIMCSTRSACSSKSEEENRSLKAIRLSDAEAGESFRITINEFTAKNDINQLVKIIKKHIKLS